MRTEKTTSIEIKRANRRNVLRYILKNETTSRQDIAQALSLSMPTTLQNVNDLQEMGLVREAGQFESTGGRKASMITSVADAVLSVGIDITRNHLGLVIVTLAGEIHAHKRIPLVYENNDAYYDELAAQVQLFVNECRINKDRIIGAGISVPGILNEDNTILADSHALGVANVPCSRISDALAWKTTFINDANAAGLAELRMMEQSSTLVYLSLSNSVGGAVFIDGRLYNGKNQRAGEFGHMRIVPEGKQCYCGQAGCVDAYCSALVLTQEGEKLEQFFELLHAGDPVRQAVFDDYMQKLAYAAINLRMSFDCDIVLGGYVGGFLEQWLPALCEKVTRLNPFQPDCTYLHACRYKHEASGFGAAIQPIDHLINTL